jgi:hypothetical protein
MKDRLVDRLPFARIVTVLAVAFGVALGLCGLNLAMATGGVFRSAGQVGSSILVGAGLLEVAVLVLSGVGLLLTVVVWVVASAVSGASGNGSEPQRLFEGEKDEDKKS